MRAGMSRRAAVRTSTGLLLVMLCVPSWCVARDKTEYSHQEFGNILAEAVDLAHYKKAVELTARSGNGKLPIVDRVESLGDGVWRVWVTVYDYERGSTQTIYFKTFPVMLRNHGTRFEAAFLTPEIPAFIFDRALQNKYWKEASEEYAKKRKDVRVDYGREADQVSILTAYSYAGGVSSNDIRDRLEDMLVASSWVGRMAYVATRLERMELQKELQKLAPAHLNRDELPLVLAVDYSDFLEENANATEGYWSFNVEGRSLRILNHGGSVDFVYTCELSDEIDLVPRAALLLLMQKWVEKNPAKGSTTTEVNWSPQSSDWLWVKATYVLDGKKMKGEDLEKAYAEFRDKYSVKADEEVDDVLAKVLE